MLAFQVLSLAGGRAVAACTSALPALTDPVGAGSFFFCALAQSAKIVGLITGNIGVAAAGAIVGGIACGLGI